MSGRQIVAPSSLVSGDARERSAFRAMVRQGRPRQWLKNVLVFSAPGAAGALTEAGPLGRTVVMFVAFCLGASGLYYWNDLLDVEADRQHPTKRHRPIASGRISIGTGRAVGTLLLVASLALAATLGRWQPVAVLAVYLVTTMLYSSWLKHVAVIDLIVVASGFVLRAAAGAVAAAVPMSKWFVLCTTFGSLFIVSGKRYAELRELGDEAAAARASLASYTAQYLRMVVVIACGGALVSYCLWAFETAEVSGSDLPLYELSIVPMLTALLRYLLVLEQGHGAAPEEVFYRDRVLQLLGLAWIVTFGLGVYLS